MVYGQGFQALLAGGFRRATGIQDHSGQLAAKVRSKLGVACDTRGTIQQGPRLYAPVPLPERLAVSALLDKPAHPLPQ